MPATTVSHVQGFTVIAWVRADDFAGCTGTAGCPVAGRITLRGDTNTFGYRMSLTAAGKLQWTVGNGPNLPLTTVTHSATLNAGQWHHVAATFDAITYLIGTMQVWAPERCASAWSPSARCLRWWPQNDATCRPRRASSWWAVWSTGTSRDALEGEGEGTPPPPFLTTFRSECLRTMGSASSTAIPGLPRNQECAFLNSTMQTAIRLTKHGPAVRRTATE